LKVGNDPLNATREISVPCFNKGTPEELLNFLDTFEDKIVRQNLDTPAKKYATIKTSLKGDALPHWNKQSENFQALILNVLCLAGVQYSKSIALNLSLNARQTKAADALSRLEHDLCLTTFSVPGPARQTNALLLGFDSFSSSISVAQKRDKNLQKKVLTTSQYSLHTFRGGGK